MWTAISDALANIYLFWVGLFTGAPQGDPWVAAMSLLIALAFIGVGVHYWARVGDH